MDRSFSLLSVIFEETENRKTFTDVIKKWSSNLGHTYCYTCNRNEVGKPYCKGGSETYAF